MVKRLGVATVLMICMLAGGGATIGAQAPSPGAVTIAVRETAGIRRNRYPVNARVPLQKGAVTDVAQTRLLFAGAEVESQIAAESKYDDGSIQWLAVDFNATIGPVEAQTYTLEYGAGVKAAVAGRGVAIAATTDMIDLGRVRLNASGSPLIRSLNYRKETLAQGLNGFAVTDSAGVLHPLSGGTSVTTDIVKPGPVYGVVRYAGRLAADGGAGASFTVTVEMPNSKAWVKYTAVVDDPGRQFRDISFQTPFTLGAYPWLWDFGTGSWTYGSMRTPEDSVILTQTVGARGTGHWEVRTGPKGQELPYEVAAGSRPAIAEGWGHLQDAGEVIAFGFDQFGRQPGRYSIALDGKGGNVYRFAPERPAARHALTIFQHYVASPTPIGAVTSPPSMLNALVAVCDRAQYVKAGVPVPADAKR